MSTIDLEVQGMSCGSCVKHVTQALQTLPGVSGVEVDLPSGHVRVSGDFPLGSDSAIAALSSAGYPAQLAASSATISLPTTSGSQPSTGGRGGCCCH
jgi:copper chaperone